MTDRLIREGDPPAGQLACPKPQYKKPAADEYEPVEGAHGAPFAILKDTEGIPVNPASSGDITALKTELTLVKAELSAIKANQTSGDQKVQLNGSIAEGLSRRFIGINRVMLVGEIAAKTTETVHTYAYGADIEFLDFSTNIENDVSMELEAFKPDGTTAGGIFILGRSADSAKSLTPLQLRTHKSALFELLVDAEGAYKIGLRRQMPVGNGFKVLIRNSADTAYRYGLFIYYNKCAVM